MRRRGFQQRPAKSKPAVVLMGVILVIGLAWLVFKSLPAPDPEQGAEEARDPELATVELPPPIETPAGQALALAIEAVSDSEDAEYESALSIWRQLVEQFPEEPVYKINEAVTVLKWIDESNSRLSSGTMDDPQQRAELEAELSEAYEKADAVIQRLASIDQEQGRTALLQAALLDAKALRAEYPEDEAFRQRAAELLGDALAEDPAQPLLAAKLDDLLQGLAGAEAELVNRNTNALFASWKAKPRNLLLLTQAMDSLWRAQDPRLAELLEPSLDVTRPLWTEVARSIKALKPETYIPAVKESVEAGQWNAPEVRRLPLWLNLIRGMSSAFRSDYRLVKPDIMALLDTSFLNRLSEEVRPETSGQQALPVFEKLDLNTTAQSLAWFDFDLDLDLDLVVADGGALRLFECDAGRIQTINASEIQVGFDITSMLVADFFTVDDPARNRLPNSVAELMQSASTDAAVTAGEPTVEPSEPTSSNRHDTLQEVMVWGTQGVAFAQVSFDASGDLQFAVVDQDTGLEGVQGVLQATVLDMESDGDLDLILATDAGFKVMQNNGNRTFDDLTEFSMVDLPQLIEVPPGRTQLVACDFDNDLDQDIVALVSSSTHVLVLENILHGQFRLRVLDAEGWPSIRQGRDLAVAEVDGNSSWDVVVTDSSGVQVTSTRTPEPGQIVSLSTSRVAAEPVGELVVGDLTNDSMLDLVWASPAGLYFAGGKADGWSQPKALRQPMGQVSVLRAADCNLDGSLDLAVIDDSQAYVMMNQPKDNMFLAARVRGTNDVNGGGRINHFAIGTTLELWSGGRQQRRFIDQPTSHFGLGNDSPRNLRIIFPNGLTQNIETPPSNTLVEERQELKGSCPFVYGWNGQRFELITDLLWNAPLGLQTARGQLMPDRRWENLLLPEKLMQPRGDNYELRVTEELWEVAYFDHITLTAVDHPPGTRLFTNEKVGPPQIAEHQLFLVDAPVFPRMARDSQGRDQTDKISRLDGDYLQAFDQLLCQGLAEPHFVELDFGELDTSRDVRLFLTGWMHPTDTSLNMALSQNSERGLPEPPSVWVVNTDGQWECAQAFMGFPGGKPKSIVVDLNGLFLSDDHRIRICGSQQIYWDEIFVAYDSTPEEVVEQPLGLDFAELNFRGFSQLSERASDQPHWYDFELVSTAPKWLPLEGPFTRFGDVRTLIERDDDRLVVMGPGDQIKLRFARPAKDLPNGWVRDFVLHCAGWDKDADLNTLSGQGSLPLPFAGQTSYPAPPEQTVEAAAAWEANREQLTRQPPVARQKHFVDQDDDSSYDEIHRSK